MNEQDFLRMEAYLHGDVPAAERAEIEHREATEPAYAAELASRRRLNDHLRATVKVPALQTTLEALGEKYFAEQPAAAVRPLRARPRPGRWLAVAAAAILLLLALGGTYLWTSAPAGYEQFAQHQPLSLTERSVAADLAGPAEKAFNAGDYPAAIPLLRAYLQDQPADERAKLALGISLLESNQDSAAVSVFREIAGGSSSLAAYGNWYLALAAVKRGDNAAALKFLDLLPASDAYLSTRAAKLRATL